MRNNLGLCQKGKSSSLIYLAISVLLLTACATPSTDEIKSGEAETPVIESIEVKTSPEQTVIEIVSSRSAPYTGFKLIDPPRVVLDIRGMPGENLTRTTEVNDENVIEVRFEKSKTQPMATRMVVDLARAVDYKVVDQDNVITLTLMPRGVSPQEAGLEKEKAEGAAAEPRIFFKPRPISLNQVLGVDFTMLDRGKSRLIVTTDKKARYDLDRKGSTKLLLTIEEATIPPLLMRRLESTYFEGVVDRVKASLGDQRVSLAISLREMVPYHVKQTDTTISIDFSRTSIKPREKTIGALQLTERAEVGVTPTTPPIPVTPTMPRRVAVAPSKEPTEVFPGIMRKTYTGTRMTMDFVNADVTNILRLIGEVSNLNIVWGPEVKGTVSMRLKKVPWDQALDLVLANNKLAMKRVGNVIWITTREEMDAFEARQIKKGEETAKAVELGPLVIEYFTLDFAKADDIKDHIVLSERGIVRVDARTNTIIMKDVAANVEAAKKIMQRFDTPVKQIMIEARIVDARDDFTRDLGVRWNTGTEGQDRSNTGVRWQGTPLWAVDNSEASFPAGGDNRYRGSFSSSSPADWAGNLGFTFAKLSGGMLQGLALDASLALAESEGKVKIISAPKVMASNGEEATISRGDIIFRDIVTADRIDTKEIPALLSLTVTPTVSFNNFVSMDIQVTDDEASLTGKSEKKITTKLMVKSGETIVIGGIFKETKDWDEEGIPGLRKIPFLGWLFKARKTTITRTELLIFLTPRVITGKGKKI
ncbi:MAG: type IV pilus secretin PilQ [Desulfatiglandales bacterium]